jgi:hypothetical protein
VRRCVELGAGFYDFPSLLSSLINQNSQFLSIISLYLLHTSAVRSNSAGLISAQNLIELLIRRANQTLTPKLMIPSSSPLLIQCCYKFLFLLYYIYRCVPSPRPGVATTADNVRFDAAQKPLYRSSFRNVIAAVEVNS